MSNLPAKGNRIVIKEVLSIFICTSLTSSLRTRRKFLTNDLPSFLMLLLSPVFHR